MAQIVPATAVLGPGQTGLALGYRVLNVNGTVYSAFSVVGVAETAVLGTYRVAGGVTVADAGGYIVFGTALLDKAETNVEPVAPVAPIAPFFQYVVENGKTFEQILRIIFSFAKGISAGGGTANVAFRDDLNIKNRIAATVDVWGNRTAVSTDGT